MPIFRNISMYDDPADPIWLEILELAHAGEGETNDFHAVDVFEEYDPARPLYVLVHPGDVVQSKDDAEGSDEPQSILEYSMSCQMSQASDVEKLLKADWDLAVLHRFSSSYAFGVSNSAEEFATAVQQIHDNETVLYGDDLKAAARFLTETMHAAERPVVLLSGAWSEANGGCITALGQYLEAAGARVQVALSACISPDGNDEEWKPAAGHLTDAEIEALWPLREAA
jgi:hypothetical protein